MNAPTRTPRIVHRIWLGDKPPPPVAWDDATSRINYQHRAWNDENLREVRLRLCPDILRVIDCDRNPGHQSDIYRLAVVYLFGGLVVDYDVQMVRDPAPIFASEGAFVSSYTYPKKFEPSAQNCFLGGPVAHPFWAHCLASLPGYFEKNASKPVWWRTGPVFVEVMARAWNTARLRTSDRAVRLLPDWMVWQKQCGQERPSKPFAIHHGTGAWYDDDHTIDASPPPAC